MKNIIKENIRCSDLFLNNREFTETKLDIAIKDALKKVDYMMETLGDDFARASSENNIYPAVKNDTGWNTGFWTGILWISYELSGDEKYKKLALKHIPTYTKRIAEKIGVNHHDMGFIYTPSCVAAYKLESNEEAKEAAIMAADHLMSRYHEKGRFIQAWGSIDNPEDYRFIVDCLLNIPLLYWASSVTGNDSYRKVAYNHFRTTIENAIRDDGSSYHTYYMDVKTGEPVRGVTAQGASDDSCWARGQAWCIYGMILTRIYVDDPDAVDMCKIVTNYFLNRLPKDYVPYWDLSFADGDDEPRDSSSASIAVCGMLELIKHLPENDPEKKIYQGAVEAVMSSLYENYSTKDVPESNGLLLHAVYSKPANIGVDECNIWGCYFYMEALIRMKKNWNPYW